MGWMIYAFPSINAGVRLLWNAGLTTFPTVSIRVLVLPILNNNIAKSMGVLLINSMVGSYAIGSTYRATNYFLSDRESSSDPILNRKNSSISCKLP